MIPYKSPGTRYGTLPHRCGYLGYKKESRGSPRVRTASLLSNPPFLLPILTGQDLSKELNRQSQWHQLLLNPPLIHRQFTSPCGRIVVCFFTRLPLKPAHRFDSVNPKSEIRIPKSSLLSPRSFRGPWIVEYLRLNIIDTPTTLA